MLPSDPITAAFIATRWIHFGACLLLLGAFTFDRFVLPAIAPHDRADVGRLWRPIARKILLACIVFALISGAAWLALVAIDMSGLPWKQALGPAIVRLVWSQTHFGRAWQMHALCWLVASGAGIVLVSPARPSLLRSAWAWTGLTWAMLLCASLAWAGHGISGGLTRVHLPADVAHLVVCGFWPAGLLPFAWLLLRLRHWPHPHRRDCIARLTARFSSISLVSVVLLAATGIINTWALLGPMGNLVRTAYGKTLLLKIILFGVMAALGAINLLRLRPRLHHAAAAPPTPRRTAGWLQFNVTIELLLAAIVILIVASLGLLPPGVD